MCVMKILAFYLIRSPLLGRRLVTQVTLFRGPMPGWLSKSLSDGPLRLSRVTLRLARIWLFRLTMCCSFRLPFMNSVWLLELCLWNMIWLVVLTVGLKKLMAATLFVLACVTLISLLVLVWNMVWLLLIRSVVNVIRFVMPEVGVAELKVRTGSLGLLVCVCVSSLSSLLVVKCCSLENRGRLLVVVWCIMLITCWVVLRAGENRKLQGSVGLVVRLVMRIVNALVGLWSI